MTEQGQSTVAALLDKLAAGQVSLGEVVTDLAGRPWPTGPGKPPDLRAAMDRELEDPEPIDPNSWAAVEAAYVTGKITDQQYAALYHARSA